MPLTCSSLVIPFVEDVLNLAPLFPHIEATLDSSFVLAFSQGAEFWEGICTADKRWLKGCWKSEEVLKGSCHSQSPVQMVVLCSFEIAAALSMRDIRSSGLYW